MRSSNIEHELSTLIRKAKLKFPDVAKEDLISVLNNFKDLQPDIVNFVFPDGISRNCLSLAGTIPIHYKGGKYNIPIALYFLDNHPYNGPYCYVKPTHNMRIRASPTVDTHGRIYLPYLTEWQYPNYDTPGLLQVMTISFQEKCPVYSVGPTSGSGGSTATNNSSGGNSPAPAHTPYPTSANPPYPTASSANNPPYPSSNPPPPYPTADPPPHLMPQPNLIGNSAGSGYPTHTHYQPAVPPPLYPPPLPSSTDRSTPTQNAGSSPPLGTGYGTIQPTHIRASLLSAVEDKIRQKLHERMATPFAELQSIDANLKELHSGKQQLREMLDNIGRDRQELERIMGVYTSKKQELERALECANANGAANGTSLNVEDAIDAQTPVHRQILNCYVKDCSIDDTIYCLGQALKRGTVNLPTYLKYVRQLSHQQFEQRLLMQKCRERARLPV